MNKKVTGLFLMTALIGLGINCRSDDTNATGNNNNPVTHPVNAYTNHEVKEDMKDSQEYGQKAAESKAAYKQAKADYEKSLKSNGASSSITVDAKKRMADAHKEMNKYNKKTTEANKDLKKHETQAQQ